MECILVESCLQMRRTRQKYLIKTQQIIITFHFQCLQPRSTMNAGNILLNLKNL